MTKWQLAVSCSTTLLNEDGFRRLAEAGISMIEVSPTPESLPVLDWTQLRRWSDRYGVELWSFHLPFQPFDELDVSGRTQAIRDHTAEYLSGLICKAAQAGIRVMVVHPSGEPYHADERKARLESARDVLHHLADTAQACGAVLAVENLPRTCIGRSSSEMLALLDSDSRLRSCFDTNHLLDEDAEAYIAGIGSRIITTHFSDYDFLNERHWLPGEGDVDWPRLLHALEKAGYEGPLLYEVSLNTPPSIRRERPLTLRDFAENHRQLTRFKKPEINSSRVPEVCVDWHKL